MGQDRDHLLLRQQLANIVLFTVIMLLMPSGGFLLWFFGGFFVLLIQLPLFVILTGRQLVGITRALKNKLPINWGLEATPFLLLICCILLIQAGEQSHLTDPFYDDAFKIEVRFHPDGTAKLSIDGQEIDAPLECRLEQMQPLMFHCSNNDVQQQTTSILVHLASPVKPGADQVVSGAVFDDEFGIEHSTWIAGTVYLEFNSGMMTITDIVPDNTTKDKGAIVSGTLTAVAKRHHKGP